MIVSRLVADARKQVVALVDDLRTVAATDAAAQAHVAGEYHRARAAGRTAFGQAEWAEGLYAQVAVAWVLGCVFVRFCEDNGLVADPLLGGPGIRARIALDHRAAYLQAHPDHDDRQWLRQVFARLRDLAATGEVFGAHNPVWTEGLLPSADAARRLREALAGDDPGTGRLRHDFGDPGWDTRFLGDLYQDLSEHAKKTYALLQTPHFVEAFILDRTLEPALATFGLAQTTIIDPTCGSGHFLLGAFDRLFRRWADVDPAANPRVLAQRALDAIGGIDLNPFAASIARFRLLLAALRAGGDTRLADAPAYEIHVAVGDSLLHGDPPGRLPGLHVPGEEQALVAAHGYAAEDVAATRALLERQWHAVVGNPPYVTVKDPALNTAYRARFKACSGKYSLGVPFTERFWQLARSDSQPERAGYIGLITANSFMKREMGRKLIREWMPAHDLTHVIDTSGAYIPGHGTPTVILLGRNRNPVGTTVRAVMGIRGEPSRPAEPEQGLVWSSIVGLVDEPGSQSDYVSVVDLERVRLHSHPWSIGGGGAAELKERLDIAGTPLGERLGASPGFMSICGYDEATAAPHNALVRSNTERTSIRPLVRGEDVRDWKISSELEAFFPYFNLSVTLLREPDLPGGERRFWHRRTLLWARATFSRQTYREEGRHWWEWHQISKHRVTSKMFITFSNVATHNHFALSKGGAIHNPHAAIIDLADLTSEARHLELLGVLNSSTACFWMKQVYFPKGGDQVGNEGARIRKTWWDERFEFDGTKLKQTA